MTNPERLVWAAVFAREVSLKVGGSANAFDAAILAARAVKTLRRIASKCRGSYRFDEEEQDLLLDEASAMLVEMTGDDRSEAPQ